MNNWPGILLPIWLMFLSPPNKNNLEKDHIESKEKKDITKYKIKKNKKPKNEDKIYRYN